MFHVKHQNSSHSQGQGQSQGQNLQLSRSRHLRVSSSVIGWNSSKDLPAIFPPGEWNLDLSGHWSYLASGPVIL